MTLSLLPRIHSGNMFFHVAVQESNIVGFCNIDLTGRVRSFSGFICFHPTLVKAWAGSYCI
jgi:hypothetical protein